MWERKDETSNKRSTCCILVSYITKMSQTHDLLEKNHIYNQYKSVKKKKEVKITIYRILRVRSMNPLHNFNLSTKATKVIEAVTNSRLSESITTISGLFFLCVWTVLQSAMWIAVSIWIMLCQIVCSYNFLPCAHLFV